jgi:poly(ADP-ribose) glycohydrolase
MHQRVIWPWETRKWIDIKTKISQPINSIIELDSRIASLQQGRIHPRQLVEIFNRLQNNDQAHNFITKIVPMMQQLLEHAPKTFHKLDSRVLCCGENSNIVINRLQAATIISGMWFGLFDYDYLSKSHKKMSVIENFSEPNFQNGFESYNIFMLQCLLNYFERVYNYLNDTEDIKNLFESENIIIKRNFLINIPDWKNIKTPISSILIGCGPDDINGVPTIGTIDDSPAKIHTIYAHEFIGGEMFKENLTQEEITILIRPELLTATIFCEKLGTNETITVFGAEKMSQYAGIGSSVRYVGNFIDNASIGYSTDETSAMVQHAVIFMDASPKTSGVSQFITDFERDLNKAFCGFNSIPFKKRESVAIGNWTYGFMGGNIQLKFIQILLASNLANKDLIYYPTGKDFEEKIIIFNDWIQQNKLTIGDLFKLYIDLIKKSYSGPQSRLHELNIFECLMDMILS